jgi:hypothetical protein
MQGEELDFRMRGSLTMSGKLRALGIIHAAVGLSAIAGGLGLILTNGLGMPLEWLAGSPFLTYLWPGIILLSVVGGTSLAASYAIWRRTRLAEEMSAVASFGLQLWIFVEIYIIKQVHWLHILYFVLGTVSLILLLCELQKRSELMSRRN